MSDPYLIILTQGDHKFHARLKPLLWEYDGVRVKLFDACAFSLDGDEIKSADAVLVNADRFHLTEKCKKSFRRLSESAIREGRKISVFMLTTNLRVEDFLRNQNYFVTDTIDISGGLGGLRRALDSALFANHEA